MGPLVYTFYTMGPIGTEWYIPQNHPLPLPEITDENDSIHRHAKHIDICYHFIRSYIESGLFTLSHVSGPLNSADLLTKPLSRPVFLSHVFRLGLVSR